MFFCGAIAGSTDIVEYNKNMDCRFHYSPPSLGGWGILRAGLLVPESHMMFVSPYGCGRHGAIGALQLGIKDRVSYFCIQETDIVTGRHLEEIYDAVDEIMRRKGAGIRAFMLTFTCTDHMLGSDYEPILRELERIHGIPFRLAAMNPIVRDGKFTPEQNIQRTVMSFLDKNPESDDGINVLGSFSKSEHFYSELKDVLEKTEMGPLRHVSDYETFEAYQEMGRSKFNLLIKEEGRLCAEHLEQSLGVPYYFAPVAFRLPGIRENYEIIERSLGVVLDTDEYEQAASCQLAEARRRYAGSTAAVGAGAHSFEIARLLFETGVAVPYIFADAVTTREMEHYEWIRMNHPEAIIMPPTAPEMSDIRESALSVSFCVGYSAGYYCNGDVTVPLHAEIEYYGYLGLVRFLQAIDYAFENPEPIDSLTKKQVFII